MVGNLSIEKILPLFVSGWLPLTFDFGPSLHFGFCKETTVDNIKSIGYLVTFNMLLNILGFLALFSPLNQIKVNKTPMQGFLTNCIF